MIAQVSRIEVARFTAASATAVPLTLFPLVTVPFGFTGLLKRIELDLLVGSASPSGSTYEVHLLLNGAVADDATIAFTEPASTLLVALDVLPNTVLVPGDELEVVIVPTYAGSGTVNWTTVAVSAILDLSSIQPVCTATDASTGALTTADFEALITSCTDPSYLVPIRSAGDGNGKEVFSQSFEQLRRVSEAIDRTMSAMFLDSWSGQSAVPAQGGRKATVPLLYTRTLHADRTCIVLPSVYTLEQETETGSPVGIPVLIQRRYSPETALVFNPGEAFSLYARASAEKFGYGYNNPQPETLTTFDQPGSGLTNTGASVVTTLNTVDLVAKNEPDTFTPNHVGQYVEFLAGANIGRTALAIAYRGPNICANPPSSGTLSLMRVFSVRTPVWGPSLQFLPGEEVTQPATGSKGVVLSQSGVEPNFTVTIWTIQRSFEVGTGMTLLGVTSGAFAILDPGVIPEVSLLESDVWVAEDRVAEWKIMDWATDWGITVTNPVQPSGGRSAMLDALGGDRGVQRQTMESDDAYRARIRGIADVVSPNSIQRAIVSTMQPYGLGATVREVGTDMFPGFFFDAYPTLAPTWAFAYDMDFTVRPQDKFNLLVDILEMRAFFLIEVHRSGLGEFGFAYDYGTQNAFDAPPYLVGFDGYPVTTSAVHKQLWGTISDRKAGGVGYDFVQEPV